MVVRLFEAVQNIIDQSSLPPDTQPPGSIEENGVAVYDIATEGALRSGEERHSLYFEILHLHPIKVTLSFEASGAINDAGDGAE